MENYLPEDGLFHDAGGGPGRYTVKLAKMGYDVVLLDLTLKLLEIATQKINEAGVKDTI